MPQLLSLLVKDRPLTRAEWIKLVEDRLWTIKPHLDIFTLREIGDLRLLASPTGTLKDDNPKVVGDSRGLKFQGIFESQCTKYEPTGDDSGVLKFWGVSRSGEWVLVRVILTLGERTDPKYNVRLQKAEVVEIQKVSLYDLLIQMGTTPLSVWDSLGVAIQSWESDRKRIFEIAQDMATLVRVGERLYHALPHESGG